jgi:predicted lipoprotein with Yx(FWY)xxD motif
MTTSRPLLAAAGLAVCLAAGCSTSSAGTTAGGSPGTSPGASQAAAVDSHDSSFGRILVTGSGTTLYLLSADSADTSTCTDAACTAVWPPLLTDGTPRVGPGVRSGLVGVTTRPDGTHQVTYASHPLYTFIPGGATPSAGPGTSCPPPPAAR